MNETLNKIKAHLHTGANARVVIDEDTYFKNTGYFEGSIDSDDVEDIGEDIEFCYKGRKLRLFANNDKFTWVDFVYFNEFRVVLADATLIFTRLEEILTSKSQTKKTVRLEDL